MNLILRLLGIPPLWVFNMMPYDEFTLPSGDTAKYTGFKVAILGWGVYDCLVPSPFGWQSVWLSSGTLRRCKFGRCDIDKDLQETLLTLFCDTI